MTVGSTTDMFKKGKEKETVICCYNPHMNWSISALPDSMWDRLQLTHDIHFLLAIITRGWCEVKPKLIENEHIIKKFKTQDTWHVWSWFVLLFWSLTVWVDQLFHLLRDITSLFEYAPSCWVSFAYVGQYLYRLCFQLCSRDLHRFNILDATHNRPSRKPT